MTGESKRRVIHLLPEANVGGVENHVVALAAGLRRRGRPCTVVSNGGALVARLQEEGVEHVKLPVHRKSPALLGGVSRAVEGVIRDRNAGIVHVHSRAPAWASYFAAKRAGLPFIVTAHGQYAPHWFSRVMIWGNPIICVSEKVREHLIEKLGADPARLRVIYNGIRLPETEDPEKTRRESAALRREFGLEEGQPVIGAVGRLAVTKGLIYLLEAVALALKTHPGLKTLLIGDGPMRGEIEQKMRSLGIERSVIITGRRDDVGAFLKTIDLFVNSSLSEGFGLACLEAMAHRAPIVATNVGGIPEMLADNRSALLSPPGDPARLAAAIVTLLEDDRLQARLTDCARHDLETRFTLDRMVEEVDSLYEEALRSPIAAAHAAKHREGARKALIVASEVSTERMGAHLTELAVGLEGRGWAPVVACPYGEAADRLKKEGVEHVQLPSSARRSKNSLAVMKRMRKGLLGRKFEIVHFVGLFPSWMEFALPSPAETPRVLTYFDEAPVPLKPESLGRMKRIFLGSPLVGGAEGDSRLQKLGAALKSIPFGLPGQALDPEGTRVLRRRSQLEMGLPADCRVIGVYKKFGGPDDEEFFRLAAEVSQKNRAVRFLLFGSGLAENAWSAAALKMGVGSNVTLMGRRSRLAEMTAPLDALCCLSGGSEAEFAAQCAMARGVAAVWAGGGSNGERDVEETGVLIEENAAAALKAALDLLDDPGRLNVLKQAARNRAERDFAPHRMLDGVLETYEELAGGETSASGGGA